MQVQCWTKQTLRRGSAQIRQISFLLTVKQNKVNKYKKNNEANLINIKSNI